MNRNIRIAKELVRIAKELTALSNYSISKSFGEAVKNPKKAPEFFRSMAPKTSADDLDPELEDDLDSVEI